MHAKPGEEEVLAAFGACANGMVRRAVWETAGISEDDNEATTETYSRRWMAEPRILQLAACIWRALEVRTAPDEQCVGDWRKDPVNNVPSVHCIRIRQSFELVTMIVWGFQGRQRVVQGRRWAANSMRHERDV